MSEPVTTIIDSEDPENFGILCICGNWLNVIAYYELTHPTCPFTIKCPNCGNHWEIEKMEPVDGPAKPQIGIIN